MNKDPTYPTRGNFQFYVYVRQMCILRFFIAALQRSLHDQINGVSHHRTVLNNATRQRILSIFTALHSVFHLLLFKFRYVHIHAFFKLNVKDRIFPANINLFNITRMKTYSFGPGSARYNTTNLFNKLRHRHEVQAKSGRCTKTPVTTCLTVLV